MLPAGFFVRNAGGFEAGSDGRVAEFSRRWKGGSELEARIANA